jgi:tetratricopeptide (TPR) repeat protein
VLVVVLLIAVGALFMGVQLWANSHYRAAKEALKKQDLNVAKEHLEKCLEVWSNNGEVLLAAAQTARRMGYYDKAEGYLERLANADWPEDAVEVEHNLIEAQRGYFPAVEGKLQTVVEQTKDNPDVVLVLEVLAKHYLSAREPYKAEKYLNMWVKRDPENTTPLLWRGWLWGTLGNLDDAAADLRRALRINPDDPDAQLGLGEILMRARRPKQALPHLLFVERWDGANVRSRVLLDLAQCRAALGNQAEARKLLDRILAQDPKHVGAMVQYAKITTRHADAERWLRRALRVDPNDREANYRLYGVLQHDPGRKKEAKKYFTRFKSLDKAIKRADEIIGTELPRARERTPALEYEVGTLYLTMGRHDEAEIWLQRAFQHGYRDRALYLALADCYAGMGKPKNAAKYRQLARQGQGPRQANQTPPGGRSGGSRPALHEN